MRRGGCVVCGGTLHRGNYQRKTRGFGPGVDAECLAGEPGPDLRLSFCCGREGCRTRHTPASVRFLGRRVYAAVVVIGAMAVALTQSRAEARGPAPTVDVSPRTLGRWRQWWGEEFPVSGVWRAAQGRFMPPVDASALPGSLLPRFGVTAQDQLLGVLRLLLPLSGRMPPDTS